MFPNPGSLWRVTPWPAAKGHVPLYDEEKIVCDLGTNTVLLATGNVQSDPDFAIAWINVLLHDGRSGWIVAHTFDDGTVTLIADGAERTRHNQKRFTRRRR